MGELTPEAKAEIERAIAIVRSDQTGRYNEELMRKILREEMADYAKNNPPTPPKPDDPPTPPVDPPPGPTPPPPVPPAPPTPPTPPVDPPPTKRRSSYWGDLD